MVQTLETWTRHTVYVIIIESHHRNMVNHHQLIRYQTTLSTECHVIHITKYGQLPPCSMMSYQATLYNIMSYSTHNRIIHNHH
jgi:hypothetical protein